MLRLTPRDRPREKLERLGAAALGDNELLAVVLGSGTASRDSLAIADNLLEAAGGLHGLIRATQDELRGVAGIGPARSAQILASLEVGRRTLMRAPVERPRFSSPRELALHLLPDFGGKPVEQFGIVMLDTRFRLLRTRILSVGTVDHSVVHPREVFREALAARASAIVLFHNHPSGDPTPSPDDLLLTRRLVEAGRLMGVDVTDHVILADSKYISLRECGQLQ